MLPTDEDSLSLWDQIKTANHFYSSSCQNLTLLLVWHSLSM